MIEILQITSGRGPNECGLMIPKLIEEIKKESNFIVEVVDISHSKIIKNINGKPETVYKSAVISIEGHNISPYISTLEGTIQWVCPSIFRKYHKRNNWFVGINKINLYDQLSINNDDIMKDIRMDTFRSGGPGGQHVNTTDSAVRMLHIPTGISVVSNGHRSQFQNRKIAFHQLYIKLIENDKKNKQKQIKTNWMFHNQLILGNPIRIYKGHSFKREK